MGSDLGEVEEEQTTFSAASPGSSGKSPRNAAFERFLSMLSFGLLSWS